MKKIIFLALLILFFSQLKSQNFAPLGARWHYTQQFAFSNSVSYFQIQSVGDTVIKGKNCRILSSNGGLNCGYNVLKNYVYEQDSIVYFYLAAKDSFQILYNFKAAVDSSWNVMYNSSFPPYIDTLNVKVDSITYININGNNLKQLWVKYRPLTSIYQFYHTSKIIEKIGDVSFLFNLYGNAVMYCDGNYSNGLRCYQDPQFGLYTTGIAPSCTYTGVNESSQESIEIYPNPVTDILKIKTVSPHLQYIELRNILGQLEFSTYFNSSAEINLKDLPKGIYILSLKENNKIMAVKKILKS